MKQRKKAESLIWIIIWVFILSFVVVWIWSVLSQSKELTITFDKKMDLDVLTSNSNIIINNVDTSFLNDWDVFFIHKNDVSKTFDIYLWEHNNEYKYINRLWDKVDNPHEYNWDVYIRTFLAKIIGDKTAIKVVIKRLTR